MMSSATDNQIVPFGKYKGQPTELLLAHRPYCEWLAAQPWFQDRYPRVYNVIINGPSSEEQCTPEHNAMQNLFLLARHPHAENLVKLLLNGANPEKRPNLNNYKRYSNCTYECEEEPTFSGLVIKNRKAEVGGWDVAFDFKERWTGKWRLKHASGEYGEWETELQTWRGEEWAPCRDTEFSFVVELKPSLGDDYPAVLRQILKRLHAAQEAARARRDCRSYHQVYDGHPVLVVGRFDSEVTPLEDLKAIFWQHKIAVVTLSEIEAINENAPA